MIHPENRGKSIRPRKPDAADRFTTETQEGEHPRECISRRLYSGAHLDPTNSKERHRLTPLDQKDVIDYKASVGARENWKSGRLEAGDANDGRERDLIRRGALIPALGQLGKLSYGTTKPNKLADLMKVPDFAQWFVNIRENRPHILGEMSTYEQFHKAGRKLQIIGGGGSFSVTGDLRRIRFDVILKIVRMR